MSLNTSRVSNLIQVTLTFYLHFSYSEFSHGPCESLDCPQPALSPGTLASLSSQTLFKPLQSFSRHSPSRNSFGTTLSHQSLLCTHIQNLHLVRAGINSGTASHAQSLRREWLGGRACVQKPGTTSYTTEGQEKRSEKNVAVHAAVCGIDTNIHQSASQREK